MSDSWQGQKFVGYERDIPTRKASDRILREHGVKPTYVLEFDNIETIKRAVEIGLGCAIVPRMTVENEVARGTLRMLEFQEGTFLRPLAIIYKRGRELSPAVRKFIEVLTTSNIVPRARGDKTGRQARARRRVESALNATATRRREGREDGIAAARYSDKNGRVVETRPFLFSGYVLQKSAMTPEAKILLDSIRDLAPSISARSAEIDAGRRLPPDLLAQLTAAGCFRMFVPKSHGGLDIDVPASMEIIETLATADGSTGWVVMIGCETPMLLALLSRKHFDSLYANGSRRDNRRRIRASRAGGTGRRQLSRQRAMGFRQRMPA